MSFLEALKATNKPIARGASPVTLPPVREVRNSSLPDCVDLTPFQIYCQQVDDIYQYMKIEPSDMVLHAVNCFFNVLRKEGKV